MATRRLKFALLTGWIIANGLAWSAWSSAQDSADYLYWLIGAAMLWHQCEENVFTELILGPGAAFLAWVRRQGYDLSPTRAFFLNAGIGWTLSLASVACGERFIYLPVFVALVEGINGAWHLSLTSFQQRWSPGTLTGVVFSVPLAYLISNQALNRGLLRPESLLALFLGACLAHHAFLGSLPRVRRA